MVGRLEWNKVRIVQMLGSLLNLLLSCWILGFFFLLKIRAGHFSTSSGFLGFFHCMFVSFAYFSR